MINKKILLILFFLLAGFATYRYSFGLFTSSASNNENNFIASEAFPTKTPTPLPLLTNTPTPTPITQLGDVVINEINWAGNNDKSEDEWIELRNMTSRTINLTGWKIENFGAGSGTAATITLTSGTIGPNSYFLIAKYDENDSNSRLNVHPDITHPTPDISLLNTGEILTLISDLGTTIDVTNRDGNWYAGVRTPEPKKSMERKDPPGDGTVSTNWQTATTHTGMDGSTSSDEFGTPKNPNGV